MFKFQFNKIIITIISILFCIVLFSTSFVLAADKWPSQSILMVVPFNPGGATDQIARILEPFMEEKLGVPIAVQNMPGGATSIGNQYVFDAPHDGYTILVNPTDIVSIAVMGQSELTWRDWEWIGIAAAVPNIFVVNVESDIKNITDLENIIKKEQISISCAASGCAWTRGMALFAKLIDAKMPLFVPMGGGKPAALSALKNEVPVASCGVPEAIDLIDGGKLRALAYWGAEDIVTTEGIVIPSITNKFPEFEKYVPFGGWIGVTVAKGTPVEVVEKIQEAYNYAISQPKFKEFIKERYFIEAKLSGKAAEEYAGLSSSVNAWLLYDLGIAPNSPEKFNIPRP